MATSTNLKTHASRPVSVGRGLPYQRDAEIFADFLGKKIINLAVAWDGRGEIGAGVIKHRMPLSFAE